MAVFSVNSFSSSFSIIYKRLVGQIQRKAPTIRLASDINALGPDLTGDKMRWVARFSGQVAAAANADGGNLLTAASDVRVEASLAYGTYDAPLLVTDDILTKAQSSAGVPAAFNVHDQLIGQNAQEALEALLKKLEQDLYAGDGTSNAMTGLATIIANSGTYAGINSATYTDWKATVQGNSGTLRNLTVQLMKTLLRTVSGVSPMGRPNLALCQGAVFDSLENLFTPYTLMSFAPVPGPAYPPGLERVTMNPATINLPGGQIKADGFRVIHWQSGGVYFIEAPDAIDQGATNANNSIFFLNSQDFMVTYLPRMTTEGGMYNLPVQYAQLQEQGMGPLGEMPIQMVMRGRTKHQFEWDLTAWTGVRIQARNTAGKLQDVQ